MSTTAETDSPRYLPQLLASRAETNPERVFIQEAASGRVYTYAETEQQVSLWVARLLALGVRAGDPVLVMLPTSAIAAFVWIAIARLRAIEAPANLTYRGRILAHVVKNSKARIAIVVARALEQLGGATEPLGTLETTVVVDNLGVGVGDPQFRVLRPRDIAISIEHETAAAVQEGPAPQDIASLLYTSGTTGLSKGVLVTWKQIDRIAHWYFPLGSLEDHEVVYAPFPMNHLSGKVLIMIAALTNGSVVLRERFKTDRYWADVHTYGCTSTMLLGSMPDFVLNAPGFAGREKSTLDKINMNPFPPSLPEFIEKFGVRVCMRYGSTEVGIPLATGWDLGPAGSCGRVCPDYEVRIVDETDNEVPHGEVGELVVRTGEPWLTMAGYWGMPEATVAAWRNLWFHTGDIMRRDEAGNFFFVDRVKDMIRRRGENISSMELEREVLDHDAILDCAVVGVRGDWPEEEIMVAAMRAPGASITPRDLAEFLSDRVAPFMVPRFVWIVDDLPRTDTGKVRKQALRDITLSHEVWDRAAHGQR